jgi:NAD(P)-dependent dehydrogenase (short-subunit alcohol dehydrogenase family)
MVLSGEKDDMPLGRLFRIYDPQMRDRVLADSPIRRAAEPEDIAGLVLFLVSDLANVITGAVYPVDGARTAH